VCRFRTWKNGDHVNKPIKTVVAVLAVAAAVVSVYLATASRAPKIDLGPYSVLGAVTADETAKLVGNKGEVVLMSPDSGTYKNPSVEAQVKAFRDTLKQRGSFNLVVEKFPITPMLMLATGGGVPSEELFKALKVHPNAAAFVLFCRFPQMPDSELEELKKHSVKMVAVSSFYPDYQRLLDRQLLHLAIVPRPDSADTASGKTVRERFDQQFLVIGPQARAP
jgi:hypothetical protein